MDEVKVQTEADQSTPAVPSAGSQPQPHPVHIAFIGPHGLRAGWRLLVYLTLVFLLYWLAAFVLPQNIHGIWRELTDESRFMAAALLPALLMGAFERRPFGAYGLPGGRAFGKLFWVGIIWGIAGVSLLVFAIGGFGDFALGSLALHGMRVLKFAAFWGGFFLVVGFFEEFLFRGYSQFTLATGMGFWPAAMLLSFIFAATHAGNPGETLIGLVAVAAVALFFCFTLRRTGDLWFAVGFHASFDWGESFLYSVPDSGTTVTGHLLNSHFQGSRWITGGSVGPEGSVLVFLVIAMTWVAFDRMYPKVKHQAVSS
jgi:membrane protease YdiL (CAAX protease family)